MKQTLAISGMSCQHCVMAVKKALAELEEVTVLDVSVGSAEIEVRDGEVAGASIAAALEEEGFSLSGVSTDS